MTRRALVVVDVQSAFRPPQWLIDGITEVASLMPSIATIELHDESITPFQKQLGVRPPAVDKCPIAVDRVFIKHGYLPPRGMIDYLKSQRIERTFVCGIQADACVLGAGYVLFDAGLQPTLLEWLTVGSELDPSGGLGNRLWKHHFGATIASHAELLPTTFRGSR